MKGVERRRRPGAAATVLLASGWLLAAPAAFPANDLGAAIRNGVGWMGSLLRRAPDEAPVSPPSPVVPAGMALIAGGRFRMGDSFGEGGADERPLRERAVAGFHMDRTEVTLALWQRVSAWGEARGYDLVFSGAAGVATNHPVHYVSWYDCVKWCNARSEMEGLAPCYTVGGEPYRSGESAPVCDGAADGYRLPTEAEWEYAARGGAAGRRFPWDGADDIGPDRANYRGAALGYDRGGIDGYHPRYEGGAMPFTSPVGAFPANGYGLHDMAGNVWEWCWDWYDAAAYASAEDLPQGPSFGTLRVLRGGSWYDRADRCRVASRNSLTPRGSGSDLGFRTVRALPRPAAGTAGE